MNQTIDPVDRLTRTRMDPIPYDRNSDRSVAVKEIDDSLITIETDSQFTKRFSKLLIEHFTKARDIAIQS